MTRATVARCTSILLVWLLTTACRSSSSPGAPPSNTRTPEHTPKAATPADAAAASAAPPASAPAASADDESAPDAGPDTTLSFETRAPETSAREETAPPDMLLVPGGTFAMGADEGGEPDERPRHDVTIATFWLDRTEVTQAAYDECVTANRCPPPAPNLIASHNGRFRGPNKPVVGVSWHAARAYCAFRGKRLPREAEFERAVRGDDGRRYPWGNEPPTREHTVFASDAPEDVGRHPKGRGPYGHDDLAGNVWEWLEDDYDPLAYVRPSAASGQPGTCEEIKAAQDRLRAEGKQGFTGSNPIPTECEKSIRGGAYNYSAYGLRSTNRIHHPANYKLKMTGFRCAKDAH